jgi:hypothetical protein
MSIPDGGAHPAGATKLIVCAAARSSIGARPWRSLDINSLVRGRAAQAVRVGDNTGMQARSFRDANVLHRVMRTVAVTKAGRAVFRPTAHRLDQFVSMLTVVDPVSPRSPRACLQSF